MEAETKVLLMDYGLDLNNTLARFMGNEKLMLSFLQELPEDESYPMMADARERGDWETCSFAAHALKGLSGNLGLVGLYKRSSEYMIALRTNDEADEKRLFPLMCEEYDRAVAMVHRITK